MRFCDMTEVELRRLCTELAQLVEAKLPGWVPADQPDAEVECLKWEHNHVRQ